MAACASGKFALAPDDEASPPALVERLLGGQIQIALELTLLIARKDPRRHPRVAARWLLRYLEQEGEATIEKIVFAASCLAALTGKQLPGGGAVPPEHDGKGD